METTIEHTDLGLIGYDQAYLFQQRCVAELMRGAGERVILCEHPSVLTLGRLTDKGNLLVNEQELNRRGVIVRAIDRGGDVTLHAPGQLVVYPVLDLNRRGRDLHRYLHQLEELAIALLGGFGILGQRHPTNTGVWVKEKKIASIGIGVRKWLTYHGLAVNVNTDLDLFSLIRPCGLDVEMTSMQKIKGTPVDMASVKQETIRCFNKIFSGITV